MRNVNLVIALLVSLLLIGAVATAEEINWQVISSGGTDATSENFVLLGTVSQTAVDMSSSANYRLFHGYWQEFGSTDFICGDVDASGAVDIDDVVYLIQYIFAGGPAPDPLESGDADCSGAIDIDDVVYLITYIFSGGNAPCDPDGNEIPDC
ncbi:MAG: dockerin type I domain-containing protein [Candidatus Zixiibacteriota bacterium]